jgi:hypothetical protein
MSTTQSIQEFVDDYFCELDINKIKKALVTLPQEVVVEEVLFVKQTQTNNTVDNSNDNWDYICEIELNKKEYIVYSPTC